MKNKSGGVDNISVAIIKKKIHSIATPLQHIFNLSIDKGIFGLMLSKLLRLCLFLKPGTKKIHQITVLFRLYLILQKFLKR